MRRRQLMRVLAVVATAAGCGSNGGSNAGSGGTSTAGGLESGLAQAFCDWQARCCAPAEVALLQGTVPANDADAGAASCTALAQLAVSEQMAPVTVAINEGLIAINPTATDACVAAYRDRPCTLPAVNGAPADGGTAVVVASGPVIDDVLAACPNLFTGSVLAGARCDMTIECAPGSRCLKQGGADAGGQLAGSPALGVCFPYQPLGAACATADDCDPAASLYCRGTDLTCAVPAGDGEPCLVGASGVQVACDATQHLFCDPSASICRHLPVANEPCLIPGPAVATACDPDPTLGLVCAGGTCTALGMSGDGCGGAGLAPCSPDLACASPSAGLGTCGPAPGAGDPCGIDGTCASPNVCGNDGACGPPGTAPVGAGCPNGDGDCVSRFCDATLATPACAPPVAWGVRCAGAALTGAAYIESAGISPSPSM